MRKILLLTAIAGSVALSAPAQAQRAGVLVVDTDRVFADCTACRAATAQLQQQAQQFQQRAQQLQTSLKPDADSLQAAVRALNGRQPDAALQQRITAFQQREQQAEQELGNRQRSLQSIQAHVRQQIGTRLVAVTEQVRARRQAGVVLAKDATLASDNSVDVTGEVLTALNAALPSVSVTPLPQQQQSQPQGR